MKAFESHPKTLLTIEFHCILRDWWAISLKHGQKSSQGLLLSDWAEKHKHFLAPVRSQDGRNRLELVW